MRSIWSGTISFGLVSVGVRMFPATESKELRFHFLDRKDMTPIAYEKVRRDDRKPVESDEIVRGFEIEKGRYVEIGDEDLDRLDIELTHSIDICDFVSLEEIDPIYYRKAYYLLPSQGAEKPYRLLVRALAETGKVGIAKVVIRNKQHPACAPTTTSCSSRPCTTRMRCGARHPSTATSAPRGSRRPRWRWPSPSWRTSASRSSRRSTTTRTARSSST
jgi:Ku protein